MGDVTTSEVSPEVRARLAVDAPSESSATRARLGVALLLAIYVVAFVDRQVLALLVQPIRADLEISDTQMSLLLGASFAIFYTLLGLPLSTLADRWSRRGTIGIGLVAWSAMTVACGLSQSYTQLFLARVGVGVGEAALSPAAYSWIAATFPAERRASAISAYSMGIYLGSGLAFVAGGAVISLAQSSTPVELPGFGALKPWQSALVLAGSCGAALAPLVLTLREPRAPIASAHARVESSWRELASWLGARRRLLGAHHFGFALLSLSGYAVNLWIPSVLERSHGWSRAQAGVGYGLVLGIAGALGVFAGGLFADRTRSSAVAASHLRVGTFAALLGVPCAALIVCMPSGGALLAVLAPLSFFTAAGFGVAAAAVQELAPPPLRARAASVYLLAINLIGCLGPTLVSQVAARVFGDEQHSLGRALALVAVLAGLAAAILLHAGRRAAERDGLVQLEAT